MMKRTTNYRRSAAVALAFATLGPVALAQDTEIESLTAIRAAAETYVKSLVPSAAGETTVTVGQLDSRLRLAHCHPKDLSASLPRGMTVQARSTVGVTGTCAG